MRGGRLKQDGKGYYVGGSRCACGKVGWDKKGALTKSNDLERRGNEKELRVYQCDVDDTFWHITKLP